MDELVTSMEEVKRGQEDGKTTVDRMTSASLMEDSRAPEFDAVGDGRREDNQQIAQVTYMFTSFCVILWKAFSSILLGFWHSAHIWRNTMVTMGVETIDNISQTSRLEENEVTDEVKNI